MFKKTCLKFTMFILISPILLSAEIKDHLKNSTFSIGPEYVYPKDTRKLSPSGLR